MLSSDILQQQFGPTRIVVLFQDARTRLIQTIASKSQSVLELSLVTFDTVDAFPDIHQRIVGGVSMGQAFKDAGVAFIRDVHSVSHVTVPPIIQTMFGLDGPAILIDVDILVGPEGVHYAHISELYSPRVIWPPSDVPSQADAEQTLHQIAKMIQ